MDERRINKQLKSDVSAYEYSKELQTGGEGEREIKLNAYRYNIRGILLCVINVICFLIYFAQRGYYMKEYYLDQVWFPIYSAVVEFVYMSSMVVYSFYLIVKPVYETTPQREPKKEYTIRVLIPCYKEDETIIFTTLQHAFKMIVPERCELHIYLCDDGNDNTRHRILQDCKEMFGPTEVYGEKISGRKKEKKSVNGKSENLNYSIEQIYKNVDQSKENELIVIFDADQIPKDDFLMRLVHNFDYDRRLGLLVTPQMFSNTEKYADIFNHYNIQFWEYILPAFDCTNTIFCTGSNFIIRAKVLKEVGGIPQDTVTEDFELGILLLKWGYKAKYFTDYLAIGEAPLDIKDVYKQRSRWTKGAFQILFKKNSPLQKKMKTVQKLMYASCIYTYIAAIVTYPLQQTIPLISLLLGVFPFYITIESVTILVGTIFCQQLIVFYTAKKNKKHHIFLFYYSGIAAYLYWYTYLKAITRALIGRITKNVSEFKVTPKTQAVKKQESAINYTWPYYFITVFQIIVLAYIVVRDIAYDNLVGENHFRRLKEDMEQKYTRWPNLKRIDLYDVSNICWMTLNTIPVVLLISYGIQRRVEHNISNTIEIKKKTKEMLKIICVSSFFVQKIILILLAGFLYAILYKKVKQNDTYYVQYNNYINEQQGRIISYGHPTEVSYPRPMNSVNTSIYPILVPADIKYPVIGQQPYEGYIPIMEQEVNQTSVPKTEENPRRAEEQSSDLEKNYKIGYGIDLESLKNKKIKIKKNISEIENTIVGNILPYYNNQNVTYEKVRDKTFNTTSFQMDFFNFPLDRAEKQKLVYLESQCQYYKSICVIQIQTSNGYNYTNDTILDLQKILNQFRVINYINFNREMNGQWYKWKAAPSQYINEYRRFFENISGQVQDKQTVKRLWNPNTQQSYPDYGLGKPQLPARGTIDFRLLDTNGDGKIDSKDDAYTPYYPGNQEVDIISTSVYNFGSTEEGNGNNIVPKEGTIQNFLDTLYEFSTKQNKAFGIMETGSLWINNNTRVPKTNATEYDVKRVWIQQVFNYTKIKKNTKFVLFLQETKVEDQLENTCNNKACNIQQQTVDWEFYNMENITQYYKHQINSNNFTIDTEEIYKLE